MRILYQSAARKTVAREHIYLSPVRGQTRSSFRISPALDTQPTWRAGLPTISAKAGTFFVTTAPAPIIA